MLTDTLVWEAGALVLTPGAHPGLKKTRSDGGLFSVIRIQLVGGASGKLLFSCLLFLCCLFFCFFFFSQAHTEMKPALTFWSDNSNISSSWCWHLLWSSLIHVEIFWVPGVMNDF